MSVQRISNFRRKGLNQVRKSRLSMEILEVRTVLSISPTHASEMFPDGVQTVTLPPQASAAFTPLPTLDSGNHANDLNSGYGHQVVTFSPEPSLTPMQQKLGEMVASLYDEYMVSSANGALTDWIPSPAAAILNLDTHTNTLNADFTANGDTPALISQLESAGAAITGVWGDVVSARVPLGALNQVWQLENLAYLSGALKPVTFVGSQNNEADTANRVDIVRTGIGVNGAGVDVGVLSDSFNTGPGSYAADIGTGDLPVGVVVLDDTVVGSDEGRAMLQLVHDLAPGAGLQFHTAFTGLAAFAQGITDLRNAGSDVIVDDIGYLNEPFFMDSIVAQSVDASAAAGVPYFSSAGNQSRQSYQAPLVFNGASPFHDFDPSGVVDEVQDFTVAPFSTVTFGVQWDQPSNSHTTTNVGATTDMNAYIYDATTTTILAQDVTNNIGGDAMAFVSITNNTAANVTYGLVIKRQSGPNPGQTKWTTFNFGNFVGNPQHFTNSSTVYGHANAQGGLAVAAADFNTAAAFAGIGQTPTVENFSSLGGTDVFYDTAGNAAFSQRFSPDITAADGVSTSVPGFLPFYGTSAAAPNAAAIAALIRDVNFSYTTAQIYEFMTDSAIDMDNPFTGGFDTGFDLMTGFGMVHAMGAVQRAIYDTNAAPKNFVELNPFGDATVVANFSNETDTEDFRFFSDTAPVTVNVAEGDVPFNIGAHLWYGANFVSSSYDEAIGDDDANIVDTSNGFLNRSINVFNEVGGDSNNNVTVVINAPNQNIDDVTLNAAGDGSLNEFLGAADADYTKYVAPADAGSVALFQVTNSAGIDAVLTLFDAAGAVLVRQNLLGVNGTESIIYNSVVAGATYYLRVGDEGGGAFGNYTVSANFERTSVAVDAIMGSATIANVGGVDFLRVAYTLNRHFTGFGGLDVGVYKSADQLRDGLDPFVDYVTITNPLDLTEGSHIVDIGIGTGGGFDIALPGAGAADSNDEYYPLVILDDIDSIGENDGDVYNEDNTDVLSGVYRSSTGVVNVYTVNGGVDTVTLNKVGSTAQLKINAVVQGTWPLAQVTAFNIRTYGGADKVTIGSTLANVPARMFGGNDADTLTGGSAADFLFGNAGNDKLNGKGGDDFIDGGAHTGSIGDSFTHDGTTALDKISGFESAGQFIMERRNGANVLLETDTIVGVESYTFKGGNGDDVMDFDAITLAQYNLLGIKKFTVDGGAGVDSIFGTNGKDTLKGGTATQNEIDTIFGRDGADTIDGGGGNDVLHGEGGIDNIKGNNGDDYVNGGAAKDKIDGGNGVGDTYEAIDAFGNTDGGDTVSNFEFFI